MIRLKSLVQILACLCTPTHPSCTESLFYLFFVTFIKRKIHIPSCRLLMGYQHCSIWCWTNSSAPSPDELSTMFKLYLLTSCLHCSDSSHDELSTLFSLIPWQAVYTVQPHLQTSCLHCSASSPQAVYTVQPHSPDDLSTLVSLIPWQAVYTVQASSPDELSTLFKPHLLMSCLHCSAPSPDELSTLVSLIEW